MTTAIKGETTCSFFYTILYFTIKLEHHSNLLLLIFANISALQRSNFVTLERLLKGCSSVRVRRKPKKTGFVVFDPGFQVTATGWHIAFLIQYSFYSLFFPLAICMLTF